MESKMLTAKQRKQHEYYQKMADHYWALVEIHHYDPAVNYDRLSKDEFIAYMEAKQLYSKYQALWQQLEWMK